MRGKKAKRLRRMAEALTEGQPKVAYRVAAVPSKRWGKFNTAYLHPKCTRAVYRKLKGGRKHEVSTGTGFRSNS